MKTLFKKGKIYSVQFWDHCTDDDDEGILCEVFGRVIRQTNKAVILSWWDIISDHADDVKDANQGKVTIIKSTIKQIKCLKI